MIQVPCIGETIQEIKNSVTLLLDYYMKDY